MHLRLVNFKSLFPEADAHARYTYSTERTRTHIRIKRGRQHCSVNY